MCDCCNRKEIVVVLYSSLYPSIYSVMTEHTFRKTFTADIRAIPDEEYVSLEDLVEEYIEVLGDEECMFADIMEVE